MQMGLKCQGCGSIQSGVHKEGCTWEADHSTAVGQMVTYEYAGFQYVIKDRGGMDVTIRALDGQHFAARKPRHLIAARSMYMRDDNARPRSLRTKSETPFSSGETKPKR
jgi:hypothetical protein